MVAWATCDVPLVQRGVIAAPYVPYPATTSPNEPGTLYSWVHNNLWDVNFPTAQAFDMTFRYAIGVPLEPGSPPEFTAVSTAQALTRPLTSVLATGTAPYTGGLGLGTALIEVDEPRVHVLGVLAGKDDQTSLVRVQSFADEQLELRMIVNRRADAAEQTTLLGERVGDLNISDRTVSGLTLQPFQICGVRLFWAS